MFIKLRGKSFKTLLSAKKNAAVIMGAALLVTTCSNFTYATQNVITIADRGQAPVQITTADANVGKILSKQGIVLHEGDELNYKLSDRIQDDAVIEIYRAVNVNITLMGETKEYRTTETTVGGVLAELGVTLNPADQITPSLDTIIYEGSSIEVVSIVNQEVAVQEEIGYQSRQVENVNLAPGEKVLVQAGSKGLLETVYDVQYVNGVEVSRTWLRQQRIIESVDEIVEYGPESVWQLGVVPAYRPTKYKKVETFHATAYDASPADNGIWAGKTSTGMPLVYGVIAVDPRVIPYGTKMYIESVDGQFKYGYAIAGDCGGAIKGKKVDLFFPNRSTCFQFGRRDVNIYFLD